MARRDAMADAMRAGCRFEVADASHRTAVPSRSGSGSRVNSVQRPKKIRLVSHVRIQVSALIDVHGQAPKASPRHLPPGVTCRLCV